VIDIRGVSKAYRAGQGWNQVLDNVSATFPTGRNIGIVGLNGAGKTTLLKLIGGVEPPDRGEIHRDVSISWPLGFSGAFLPFATGRESTRFIARIYGADIRDTEDFVLEFSELGRYFDMPFRTYSSGMRARLGFAISMAVEFQCYLVDELTAVGDMRFRERYAEEFRGRRHRSSVIMASHQPQTIKEFCDMTAVIIDSHITLYDGVEEGMAAYREHVTSVKK